MSIQYNRKNIKFAQDLRANMTKWEKHLWYDFLSGYKPRFQRQKAIGNFIADFYCYEAKLVIELDGSQHGTDESIKKDEFRTEILEDLGLKVIRFTNSQIDQNFRNVCEFIDKTVKGEL